MAIATNIIASKENKIREKQQAGIKGKTQTKTLPGFGWNSIFDEVSTDADHTFLQVGYVKQFVKKGKLVHTAKV